MHNLTPRCTLGAVIIQYTELALWILAVYPRFYVWFQTPRGDFYSIFIASAGFFVARDNAYVEHLFSGYINFVCRFHIIEKILRDPFQNLYRCLLIIERGKEREKERERERRQLQFYHRVNRIPCDFSIEHCGRGNVRVFELSELRRQYTHDGQLIFLLTVIVDVTVTNHHRHRDLSSWPQLLPSFSSRSRKTSSR